MRLFHTTILLLAITLCGCSKGKGSLFEVNDVLTEDSVSTERVLFSYESNHTITLTIAMMESWSMQIVSDDAESKFTISTTSGAANNYVKTEFTSTSENDTQCIQLLAYVNIISTSSGEVLYRLSVEQNCIPTAQTTLSYFTGTSLNSFFDTNINDAKEAIKSGVLGESGRYLYFLPSNSTSAALYEVTLNNGSLEENIIKEYSNFRSLDVGSMSTVIEDVKSYINFSELINGEKQRMNLVISGHGTGWIQYTAGVISSATIPGGYTNEWEPIDPLVPTRYMGASSDGFMDISELSAELAATDVKFGYILFDECFMSSVELLYRIKDFTNYVIASPCEIMATGFPYAEIMPYMFTNNGSNYDLLGICKAYYNYYTTAYNPYGCVAVCVTKELEALAAIQSTLSIRELSTSELNNIQSYEGRTSDHIFFDLKQYINVAADGSSEELLNAYNKQYDEAFPKAYRLHTDYFYTNIGATKGKTIINYYSGASTSAPTLSKYKASWSSEPWAIATVVE